MCACIEMNPFCCWMCVLFEINCAAAVSVLDIAHTHTHVHILTRSTPLVSSDNPTVLSRPMPWA